MGALLQWPAACGDARGALPPILVDPVDSRPMAWGGHVMGPIHMPQYDRYLVVSMTRTDIT